MLLQALVITQHPVWSTCRDKESTFVRTVRKVSMEKIPRNANVITSHVIYEVKVNDDGPLKMKARIAPGGNKDKDRNILKTDSAECPPNGIRILSSIATIKKWPLTKIDFTSAFLQTGDAKT